MIVPQLLGPNGLIYCVEDDNQNVHILWGGQKYYSFQHKDTFTKNLGIALLADLHVLQSTVCEIFQVNRRTITRIHKLYKKDGIDGLINYEKGRQRIENNLKDFVIKRYIELEKTYGYQKILLAEIDQKVEEGLFNKGICRSKLQDIILTHKREIKQKQKIEKEEALRKEKEKESKREKEQTQEKIREENEKQQGKLFTGEEECVQHGGAAAVIPLLGEFGLKDFIPGETEKNQLFNNNEMAISYTVLNAASLIEVEQDFKLLASYQMGGIIGRPKIPSLRLYRERIPKIVERMDMERVMVEAAKKAHKIFGFSKVIYIDGHFMPYYGKSAILYGYNSQRRLAMHGREYFFVHDANGLPVYAAISDGYRKMKHYIEEVDAKLQEIYGVGDKELLEIFDRGGYSKAFCVKISERIKFICWRSDAAKMPIITEGEWVNVKVPLQPNEYGDIKVKKMKAWERQKEFESEGKKVRLREIWIRVGKKISPALTNEYELSLPEVVIALTSRWGRQENMFKELKEHGIDRIHSYQKELYTKELLYQKRLEDEDQGICHEIINPKIKKLNKEIAGLKKEKEKLAVKIKKLNSKTKDKEKKALKRKYAGIERKITNRKKKRDRLPKKVRMLDRIEEEKIVRLADGKKLFFDWLKMCGIWAKRKIVEIIKPYYIDLRDVNKFVKYILRSRTYVSRKGKTLYVSFPPQTFEKAGEALKILCSYINTGKNIDLNLGFEKIHFMVGNKY
jgi:hypothetical protein